MGFCQIFKGDIINKLLLNANEIIIQISKNETTIDFDGFVYKEDNLDIIFQKIKKIYILKGFIGDINNIFITISKKNNLNINKAVQELEPFKEFEVEIVEEFKKVDLDEKFFIIQYSNKCANNLKN